MNNQIAIKKASRTEPESLHAVKAALVLPVFVTYLRVDNVGEESRITLFHRNEEPSCKLYLGSLEDAFQQTEGADGSDDAMCVHGGVEEKRELCGVREMAGK